MLAAVAVFLAVYVLIAFELVDKTAAALLGAAIVLLFHLVPYDVAAGSIDLNVVFLLMGMMIVMSIISQTGFIEWLAIFIAQKARGDGVLIMTLFLGVTALISAFLDNVTTVIIIAPITILITQILEVPTAPVLVMEAIFSNIGGTATLIGDPPNVLIGSGTHLTFNDFLINLGPFIAIVTVAGLLVFYLWARRGMKSRPETRERIVRAKPELAIIDPVRLRRGLPVLGLILLGFFLSRVLDVEPGIIALGGAVLMMIVCKVDIHGALDKVEWGTILFFVGLFMLVSALEYNHLFEVLGQFVVSLTQGNLLLTAIVILWFSALVSAIVDNIPLVIAMLPLIDSIVPQFAAQLGLTGSPELVTANVTEPLLWALALGACLGGNGTLVGASANVVVGQIANRNNCTISFMAFTKQGFPIMLITAALSTVYLWLRYS